MANEAHKEPTMEEILASIRKIISDDDVPQAEAPDDEAVTMDAADVVVDEVEDDFEALSADDVVDEFEVDDTETDSIFDEIDEIVSKADEAEIDDLPEPVSFDEMAGLTTPEPEIEEVAPVMDAPAEINETVVETDASPTHQATEEADMAGSAQYEKTVLTNDNTAETAAGALGKLISKMDIASENTLEGMVREMLKPMIKDWLDANLPGIVEEKVEAEVQRIARMAR